MYLILCLVEHLQTVFICSYICVLCRIYVIRNVILYVVNKWLLYGNCILWELSACLSSMNLYQSLVFSLYLYSCYVLLDVHHGQNIAKIKMFSDCVVLKALLDFNFLNVRDILCVLFYYVHVTCSWHVFFFFVYSVRFYFILIQYTIGIKCSP